MIHEIKYGGYTAVPSDYESADGDLDISMNVICEKGGLRPILPPRTLYNNMDAGELVYIHQTTDSTNHIWMKTMEGGTSTMFSFNTFNEETGEASGMASIHITEPIDEVQKVTSLGNVLMIFSKKGIERLFYDTENGDYTYLGAGIPELPISFFLNGELHTGPTREINATNLNQSQSDLLRGDMNEFIAIWSMREGKFLFPFFVRYALRLYDGTLVNHSAPILMIDSTGMNPGVLCNTSKQRPDNPRFFASVVGMTHELMCNIPNSIIRFASTWRNIVTSVDIFVSAPIYTSTQEDNPNWAIGGLYSRDAYSICTNGQDNVLKRRYLLDNFKQTDQNSYRILKNFERDEVEVMKDISSCYTFYLLKSLPLDELQPGDMKIEIPTNYLESLVTREVMTDDFRSQDIIGAKCNFVYNNRLNIGNITRKLFKGYSIDSTVPMCNDNDPVNFHLSPLMVCYSVKKNNGEVYLTPSLKGQGLVYDDGRFYLYYPNPNAFMAHITFDDGSGAGQGYDIKMKPHDFLSGAYAYFSLEDAHPTGSNMQTGGSDIEYERNIIMTSEVNNPFLFPVTGINIVGSGQIIGIAAAVKALSQGQFGQFPMYVFSDEGVWAMEVSSTGQFSSKQPVSRDVCTSAASITQVDNAVLFATDRGIMMLSGSESECISEVINRENEFEIDDLSYGYLIPQYSEIAMNDLIHLPFKDFLKGSRMIYDYINQRIIVYNADLRSGNRAYVWSLRSKKWGSMQCVFKSHVNSYPHALATDRSGNLLDVSHSVDPINDDSVSCVMVTRPLKLDSPDIFKTVDSVIQRGEYARQAYKYFTFFLWGSRDLYKWALIYASKHYSLRGMSGSPYKYFRIGFISWSHHIECLSGVSISYHGKLERDI